MKQLLIILFTICGSYFYTTAQTTLNFQPEKDNTIYESNVNASNGAGLKIFAGRTLGGAGTTYRRALLKFDLSAIPAGASVTNASLTLRRTNGGSDLTCLHRLVSDWGEAGSTGTGTGGGQPGAAQSGDATWQYTFFNNQSWSTLGGDYDNISSACAAAAATTTYTSIDLIDDVQGWVDNSGTNFGWILIGDELSIGSAVGFGSREDASATPQLSVTYTVTPRVVINELDPTNQWVELYNGSNADVDLNGWFLCNRPRYDMIGGPQVSLISGSLLMTPGSYTVLGWNDIGQSGPAEFGLYRTNSFASVNAIEDYVQYNGQLGSSRALTATNAGVWSDPSHFVAASTDPNHTIGLRFKAPPNQHNDPTMTDVFTWVEHNATQGFLNSICGEAQQISFNIPTGVYDYVDVIISDGLVAPPSDVVFRAGKEINLEPAFEVIQGATFLAEIFCFPF